MITLQDIRRMITMLRVFDDCQGNFISTLIQAYFKTRKLRISCLAAALQGKFESRYKSTQRFFNSISSDLLSEAILGFAGNYSDAVILDYTEIERRDARKTGYIGYLKDGKTRGAGFLCLSIPYKGRALPIAAVEYSSAIIGHDKTSKPLILYKALDQVNPLLKGKVIIADREFCSKGNFTYFAARNHNFVIRLKVGPLASPVTIKRKDGTQLNYSLKKGQTKYWKNVFYMGTVKVNIAAYWDQRYNEPLYVITTIDPKKALKLYKLRMKIEESFRDEKDKFGIAKIMSQKRENFIKLILFALLAYSIAVIIGEALRKRVLSARMKKKFSGLHLLFHMVYSYTHKQLRFAIRIAIAFIRSINNISYATLIVNRWGYV